MVLRAILVAILFVTSITAQTTVDFESTDSFDTSLGGKQGSPGGQLRFSAKALDEVYKHAVEMIARSLKAMVIPDVILPIGSGMLSIKNTRIVEAKIEKYNRQMLPPNRVKSRMYDGRLTSVGEWQFKPMGAQRSIAQGVFRTKVFQADLNITNQLTKSWDSKPMVHTQDCKANLQQFRVEIEGFGDNVTVIEECSNLLCQRIRAYFEDSVCNNARNYIKETINQYLSTFPSRIHLGPTGSKFILNYDLLNSEPKVTDHFIQGYLEGEVMGRGVTSAQFHANELSILDDERHMISFPLSDHAFNTLFQQAHVQMFKFSAFDLIPSSSPIKNLLKLNCSSVATATLTPTPTPTVQSRRTYNKNDRFDVSAGSPVKPQSDCLGMAFESSSVEFPMEFGDLVFKSQRPLAVFVRPEKKSYFGTDCGIIEIYGQANPDGKRELLAKANLDLLKADFIPAMTGCNVTGSISVTQLRLSQVTSAPVQSRNRAIMDLSFSKLSTLAAPVLQEMFNLFFAQYAQFPLPLIYGYQCSSPELRWSDRTVQIDCDVSVMPDAIRRKKN